MASNDGSAQPPSRPRRDSITTQTLSGIFGRPSAPVSGTPAFPPPISTATAQEHSRRRLSVTGVGLAATSPTAAFTSFNRRSSVSTAGSESIDESAIEDGDGSSTGPQTPFGRRMSFGAQALRSVRANSGPGNGRAPNTSTPSYSSSAAAGPAAPVGRRSPAQASKHSMPRTTSDVPARSDEGFNWSEQFRSRAESTVSMASRAQPSVSSMSSSAAAAKAAPPTHQRAGSMGELQSPPNAIPKAPTPPKKPAQERPKPDAIGERILRGQFMMD